MDYYCKSGQMSHIDIKNENDYKIFIKQLAINLKLYISQIPQDEVTSCVTLLSKTDNLLFILIHDLIMNITTSTDKTETQALIINLLNCFKYDTEHDFGIGSTRDECKDPDIIKCISSLEKDVSCTHLHKHVLNTINNIGINQLKVVNTCVNGNGDIIDECRKDFSSICYTIRDTKIKGVAKNVLDISTGGKTLYRALSSMIDPAGCSSKKLNGDTVLIRPNIELHIYNIGLIFYQTFYTDFRDTNSLFWIEIPSFPKFYENKKFNICLIHNGNKENKILINNIIGGSNSPFSAQKICIALKKQFPEFKKTYKQFPNETRLVRGFQLVLKGYGDFGQLFFTTFLYYMEISDEIKPHLYTDEAVSDFKTIPFYNNCILETIDTFLACIGVYMLTPMILGTDTNWNHYIINVNKRYAGKNVLESYNIYNKVKISFSTIYNIYEKNIKNNIKSAITETETGTIYNTIQSDINLKTISREYSDYYDEKIKLYIISSAGVYGTTGYSLIKIHGYSDNINIFKIEHINTDTSFWKIADKYIDNSTIYPTDINTAGFKALSKATKSDRYNRFVSSDIFCSYIEIVIQHKINFISHNLQQILVNLPNKILCQIGVYTPMSIIRQSAILIFRILGLGIFDFYAFEVRPDNPISRPKITSHLNQLRNLDEAFQEFVNYTKFIHNNLDTMCYNINLIINYLNEELTKQSTIPSYYNKIFIKYQNIVHSQNLRNFFLVVEEFYNYILSEFNAVLESLHNHNSYSRLHEFDDRLLHYNDNAISFDPKQTYSQDNYIGYLNNEIFDPTIFNQNDIPDIISKLTKYINEKYDNKLAFKLDKTTIAKHIEHINTNVSYLRKFKNYMDELKKYKDFYAHTVLTINFPPLDTDDTAITEPHQSTSSLEEFGSYCIKAYNEVIIWRFSNPNVRATSPLCTQAFIAYLISIKFTSMFDYLYKCKIIIQNGTQLTYYYEEYDNLHKSLLEMLFNIVRNGGDTTNKLIREGIESQITITKFINNILLTGDGIGEEEILRTIYDCPVLNIDNITDMLPQYQISIDSYIAYCIHNKYILNLKDSNINTELAQNCIFDQKFYTDYRHGGGNKIFSKKITIYLKKIENIKNTIKLLKKNKILNKDKIIKNNKQIDDLKLKIKEEKKKEKEKKEKLKKEKEKKEKLKKEKEKLKKEKEKLKKEKEKQEKLKKEKEKLKKEKEKLKINNSSKKQK